MESNSKGYTIVEFLLKSITELSLVYNLEGIGHTYFMYTDYIKGWNKIRCYLLEKVTFKELRKTPGQMIGNWRNLKVS